MIRFFQCSWLTINKPRNFVFAYNSTYFLLYPVLNTYCGELSVTNFIIFVLPELKVTLKAVNHLLKLQRI
jgi:hypothetical protein